jgi:hypothetical protein
MFARQAISRLFFGRHFLHPDKIPAYRFPFSGHRPKMRLRPIFTQWHYPTRFIQRNPEPSSRKDYCNSLALCHDPS